MSWGISRGNSEIVFLNFYKYFIPLFNDIASGFSYHLLNRHNKDSS
jgi:hypothetical protein